LDRSVAHALPTPDALEIRLGHQVVDRPDHVLPGVDRLAGPQVGHVRRVAGQHGGVEVLVGNRLVRRHDQLDGHARVGLLEAPQGLRDVPLVLRVLLLGRPDEAVGPVDPDGQLDLLLRDAGKSNGQQEDQRQDCR